MVDFAMLVRHCASRDDASAIAGQDHLAHVVGEVPFGAAQVQYLTFPFMTIGMALQAQRFCRSSVGVSRWPRCVRPLRVARFSSSARVAMMTICGEGSPVVFLPLGWALDFRRLSRP